eukprot:5122931-Alexandrium_andersonii.AAC.1
MERLLLQNCRSFAQATRARRLLGKGIRGKAPARSTTARIDHPRRRNICCADWPVFVFAALTAPTLGIARRAHCLPADLVIQDGAERVGHAAWLGGANAGPPN